MYNQFKIFLNKFFGRRVFEFFQYFYWKNNLQTGRQDDPEIIVLTKLVKPGSKVFDIGTHFGRYSFSLSKLVGKDGIVYSFEPVDSTFKILNRLVDNLELHNVRLFNCALSDRSGFDWIETPIDESGNWEVSRSQLRSNRQPEKPSHSLKQKVKVDSIDHFLESQHIDKIEFIKCDVEGAELMVFQGAEKLLHKHQPTVLCEIEHRHTHTYGYTPEDLVSYMHKLGYKMYALQSDKLIPVRDVTDQKNNYFFISSDHENYYF